MKKLLIQKQREIHEAVKTGDVEKTLKLIKAGVDLNFKYQHGETLLEIGVDCRHLECVSVLIKAGASPVYRAQSLLRSIFNNPVFENDIAILKQLIEAGIDVNQILEDDETPLMIAAHHGNLELVQMLVNAGANVNALPSSGYYALWNAANQGWQEIYDYLAPLTSPELRQEAELVLPTGLIRRQRANDKFTEAFFDQVVKGDIEAVKKSIKKGVNVNAISADGVVALNIASFWGYVPVVRTLIEAGANIELQDEDEMNTALIQATKGISFAQYNKKPITEHLKIICQLIKSGANVNAKTKDDWTALLEAVTYGNNLEVVKLLLQAGADVNAKDRWGNTSLSRAKKAGLDEISQILIGAGAKKD